MSKQKTETLKSYSCSCMPNLLLLFAGKIYIKENVPKKFMEKNALGHI